MQKKGKQELTKEVYLFKTFEQKEQFYEYAVHFLRKTKDSVKKKVSPYFLKTDFNFSIFYLMNIIKFLLEVGIWVIQHLLILYQVGSPLFLFKFFFFKLETRLAW